MMRLSRDTEPHNRLHKFENIEGIKAVCPSIEGKKVVNISGRDDSSTGGFKMGSLITLISLVFFGFIVFFVFKQIQFFIQSVDLYRKMISNQEQMIQLLRSNQKAE